MYNILSFDVSLEALENECKAHDFYYHSQYKTDIDWSREYDRMMRIHAMLGKLGHSRKAITVFNKYAPERFQMPLESKYYFKE
jgi:hypothetical protein|tara:strand:- start:251 stop:499 length:249 start_codon:yes stop_codon:yes gene_type:complete